MPSYEYLESDIIFPLIIFNFAKLSLVITPLETFDYYTVQENDLQSFSRPLHAGCTSHNF